MPSSIRLLKILDPPNTKAQRTETTSPLDELHESDVVWPSSASSNAGVVVYASDNQIRSPVVQRRKSAVVAPPTLSTSPLSRSAPFRVPIWTDGRRRALAQANPMGPFEEEEEEVEDEDEMVPPHEIVDRSHRTTTFSVVEGVGRTLKGRDLSSVRKAVMLRTGFLD